MFKVFKLGHRSIVNPDNIVGDTNKFISINTLSKDLTEPWNLLSTLKNSDDIDNFKRTTIQFDGELKEDLEKCSSWTHNEKFFIDFEPENSKKEIESYFDLRFSTEYKLLKYEKGDFFKDHVDQKVTDEHLYTCLIFIHDDNLKGGDLVLHDKDNTFRIVLEPSKLKYNLMVVYSIDLLHEVLPVEEGTRYVFKTNIDLHTESIDSSKMNHETYSDEGGLMDSGHCADY